MQRVYPLRSCPQFSILRSPSFCEYRVENWHLARDGSSVVVGRASPSTYSLLPLIISLLWPKVEPFIRVLLIIAALAFLWTRCTQVIQESLIVLPAHGVQLEIHRGFPPLTLFISRHFVPHTLLNDVVINEGIRRWDVRYYLVILKEEPTGLSLDVCFPNTLPHFPILIQIYRDLRVFVGSQDPLVSPQVS